MVTNCGDFHCKFWQFSGIVCDFKDLYIIGQPSWQEKLRLILPSIRKCNEGLLNFFHKLLQNIFTIVVFIKFQLKLVKTICCLLPSVIESQVYNLEMKYSLSFVINVDWIDCCSGSGLASKCTKAAVKFFFWQENNLNSNWKKYLLNLDKLSGAQTVYLQNLQFQHSW